jgi:hypothetical protein
MNRRATNLPEFARSCTAATGIDALGFDCDSGTLVPEAHLSAGSFPSQFRDRPQDQMSLLGRERHFAGPA